MLWRWTGERLRECDSDYFWRQTFLRGWSVLRGEQWQIWKLLCNSEKYVLFCEIFLVELIWRIFISLVSNLDPDIQTMDEAYWSEATEWSQSLGSSSPLLMLGFKDFQFNKHWMQQSSSLKESFINFSESKQSSLKMLKTQEIINSLVGDWCSLSTIVLSTWWRWDQTREFCLIDSSWSWYSLIGSGLSSGQSQWHVSALETREVFAEDYSTEETAWLEDCFILWSLTLLSMCLRWISLPSIIVQCSGINSQSDISIVNQATLLRILKTLKTLLGHLKTLKKFAGLCTLQLPSKPIWSVSQLNMFYILLKPSKRGFWAFQQTFAFLSHQRSETAALSAVRHNTFARLFHFQKYFYCRKKSWSKRWRIWMILILFCNHNQPQKCIPQRGTKCSISGEISEIYLEFILFCIL